MKYNFLFIVLLVHFCGGGCNKQPAMHVENVSNNTCDSIIFIPAVTHELINFIRYVDNEMINSKRKQEVIFLLRFYEINNVNYLKFVSDYYYDENNIKGYFFLNSRLIIYNRTEDSIGNNFLVNKSKLLIFNDTIDGYKKSNFDEEYSLFQRTFKIINTDSLELMSSGKF